MKLKIVHIVFTPIFLVMLLSGCNSSDNTANPPVPLPNPSPTNATLSGISYQSGFVLPSAMVRGSSLPLIANGTTITNDPIDLTSIVNWTSTNPLVAKISDAGVVTALNNGNTDAVATFGENSLHLNIVVTDMTLTIIAPTGDAIAGKQIPLSAKVLTTDNSPVQTGDNIQWEVTPTNIATIDQKGNLLFSKAGDASITAHFFGVSATRIISAIAPPAPGSITSLNVDFDHTYYLHPSSMPVGSTMPFFATGIDTTSGSQVDLTQTVNWTTTDAQIITISPSGLMTAEGIGTAKVVATFEQSTFSISVTVKDMNITIIPPAGNFIVGETLQFYAEVHTTIGNLFINHGDNIQWEVSDTSIATIDNKGQAVFSAPGNVTVTAHFFTISDSVIFSLYKPLNLTLVDNAINRTSLSWTNITNADYYSLAWVRTGEALANGTGVISKIPNTVNNADISYIIDGVYPDAIYTYRVSAVASALGNEKILVSSNFLKTLTPSNNAAVLNGDTIGSGEFLDIDLRKSVPIVIGKPHANLIIGSAYVIRGGLNSPISNSIDIIVEVTNKSEIDTFCQVAINELQLLDNTGTPLLTSANAGIMLVLGSIRDNFSTGYTDSCLAANHHSYFVDIQVLADDPLTNPTYDKIASLQAKAVVGLSGFNYYPEITVVPQSYIVLSATTGLPAQLQVSVKNFGTLAATINAFSRYILLNAAAEPVGWGTLTTDTGWDGILAPNQVNMLVGDISYTGNTQSIKVHVNYGP